jgi:hypothetical protein
MMCQRRLGGPLLQVQPFGTTGAAVAGTTHAGAPTGPAHSLPRIGAIRPMGGPPM